MPGPVGRFSVLTPSHKKLSSFSSVTVACVVCTARGASAAGDR
jgi:hypothetical protein